MHVEGIREKNTLVFGHKEREEMLDKIGECVCVCVCICGYACMCVYICMGVWMYVCM